jgi:DNA-binding transcriptional regulator YiaG
MYLYSQRSQDKFFEQTEFAFLFAFFARNEHSRNFYLEKFQEGCDSDQTDRLVNEVEHLSNQAIEHLRNSKSVLSEAFIAYLGV